MTSIKLTETAFTRLNRVARELVDLTEELARASRLATVTRDSHGPLMARIDTLHREQTYNIRDCIVAMDWAAAGTSTESDEDNDCSTRKFITRTSATGTLYWDDSCKIWTLTKDSATQHSFESYNHLRDRFPQWAEDASIMWGDK